MKVLYVRRKYADDLGLSSFPSFHRSGSIRGMKEYYFGKNALFVRSGNYIYRVTPEVYEKAKAL